MAIDLNDVKVSGGNKDFNKSSDLIWDTVPEGKYDATFYIIYPWKSITKDTTARIKDDNGSYIKDSNGNYIKEDLKDLTWNFTDVVFRIDGGDYDGYAVKGSLSTHPDMLGSAKRFLYNANLFDVSLNDLKDHIGIPVVVNVKVRTETYDDKDTGMTVTKDVSYVSYYDKVKNDLGI